MAIVFILPGLVLSTLWLVSRFGIATPPAQPVLSVVTNKSDSEFTLAA